MTNDILEIMSIDEDIKELMEEYSLDEDTAEELQELIDETGLDADDANELREIM